MNQCECNRLEELIDKVKTYEDVLHRIQLYREVIMDEKKLIELLNRIGDWSYTHRRNCVNVDDVITEKYQKLKD